MMTSIDQCIVLEPVTETNFEEVFALNVTDDQRRFVASNVLSVAQAYVFKCWEPYAIRIGPTLVGFTLLYFDPAGDEPTTASIVRFMIDRHQQRRGYGGRAMAAIVHTLRKRTGVESIELCVHPENTVARKLYESAGFSDTGRMYGYEMIYELPLT
ncbi:MAG: GNAT family N-acetyltransferase [Thermomicrobiales bacterium]